MQAFAPSSLWVRSVITFLVYCGAGIASLAVASSTDSVSLLYLAAGFGLACLLCWGRAMAVPVGLGSATVTLVGILLTDRPLEVAAWAGIAASAMGGGLQAWAAARLIQGREQNVPLPLDKVSDITRFVVLAGPCSCLINATLTSSVMVLAGTIPPADWLPQLASWWAGDTLGVLIGAPILLSLWGRPRRLWERRRMVVGIPMLAASLLLGLSIRQVQQWEQEREAAAFRQQVDATVNGVRLSLNSYMAALDAVRGLYDASDKVEREEFRRASQG